MHPSPTFSFASTDDINTDAARDVSPYESISMAPGRTGVKGVLRDQHVAQSLQTAKREREMEAFYLRMERGNLGRKTFLEEEREKREKREQTEEWKKAVDGVGARRDVLGRP